jgi:hypothetical protein
MAIEDARKARPKEILHDQTPSITTDHPFEPRDEWWSLCKHCNLAESTHSETTVGFRYYSDDVPEVHE